MNFKIDEIAKLRFINIETGQKYDLPKEITEVEDTPLENIKIRTFDSCSASFSCDNAVINEEILFDSLTPRSFDFEFNVMSQARRHKKKRINKKWLKRYGYKPHKVSSNGWKVKEYNIQTGEVELVNDHI